MGCCDAALSHRCAGACLRNAPCHINCQLTSVLLGAHSIAFLSDRQLKQLREQSMSSQAVLDGVHVQDYYLRERVPRDGHQHHWNSALSQSEQAGSLLAAAGPPICKRGKDACCQCSVYS